VQETLSDMPLYNFPVTVGTKAGANGVEVRERERIDPLRQRVAPTSIRSVACAMTETSREAVHGTGPFRSFR